MITRDVGTSTDDYSYLYERPREQGRVYDEDCFSSADDKVKFYTGLPTFKILKKTLFLLRLNQLGALLRLL